MITKMDISDKGKLLHAMQLYGFDIENIDNDVAKVREAMLHWNREAWVAKDGENPDLENDSELKEKAIQEWNTLVGLANDLINGKL